MAKPKALTVTLADGQEYQLSPLDANDLSELIRHLRYQRMRDIEAETKGMDASIRERLVEKAYDQIVDMGPEQIESVAKSISSARFMIWLSLRKKQPELSLSDVGHLVDLESFKQIQSLPTSSMIAK